MFQLKISTLSNKSETFCRTSHVQTKKLSEQIFQCQKYPVQFIETSLKSSLSTHSHQKENNNLQTSTQKPNNSLLQNNIMASKSGNPIFVQMMNKAVLKFEGYFEENVCQSRLETNRLRHLQIKFFLEDNSIQITEPRQKNSGMLQGLFLKRQNVLTRTGDRFISAYDFKIGQKIEICGNIVLITNCDKFTQDFYEKIKSPQPENIQTPSDNFEKVVLKTFELKPNCGLNSYIHNGRVPSQRKFLENDRKVLRFFATWDQQPYIIHYYLSDDCIEICEVRIVNSGKDPFPIFLNRQKIAKKYAIGFQESIKLEDCINFKDFKAFSMISILNKEFYIQGCDLFTNQFYAENFCIDFPIFYHEVEKETCSTDIVIPPSNGFGSEEDTLQNVLKLVPKPPKKDYYSIMDNTGKLQFLAKLITDEENNCQRFTY